MSQILQEFGNQFCKSSVPDIKPGYLVEVHQKIKEGNKERIQIFRGEVIRVNAGHGINDAFTVRKISGGIGVEKTFPIHIPSIIEVKVLRAYKVRRANLQYRRELSGKSLRMKEVPLNLREKKFEKPVVKEEKVEATEKEVVEEKAA